MAEIAISYAKEDRERVRPFYSMLSNKGFNVFWDEALDPGDNWDQLIRFNFSEAICVLVFLSKNSVQSPFVLHEASIALRQRKHIPVMLDPLLLADIPSGFAATKSVIVPSTGPDNSTWAFLYKGIKNVMSARPWVEELISPFREKIEALEEIILAHRNTIDELNVELKSVRKTICDAIDRAEKKGAEVTNGYSELLESFQKLRDYINTPGAKRN